MPIWTHYFAHFVVAVIATISFGITFQMPRRHYLACGLTGAVGWMVYIFCVELFALSPAIATLVATLPLTGCARFFAIRHKAPVTIFLLPGIFPLVPGAGIYYTAYYFLQGEQELFASKGGETFKVALALALGIALVCSLPLPLPGRVDDEHRPPSIVGADSISARGRYSLPHTATGAYRMRPYGLKLTTYKSRRCVFAPAAYFFTTNYTSGSARYSLHPAKA